MGIVLSKNLEKRMVNSAFNSSSFFYYYGFFDLFSVNFLNVYFFNQALFFYDILEMIFCDYWWKIFANLFFQLI
jgi:hypothetical protein